MRTKTREWLKRYIPAEIIGIVLSVLAAWIVFNRTHSFVAAAAAGWVFEGIGFYGYFVSSELIVNSKKYRQYRFFKRASVAIAAAGTNLLVEFLPAEIIDNFLIRPFLIYTVPHFVQPYAFGFLIGLLAADVIFYVLAAVGYEIRKRWLKR